MGTFAFSVLGKITVETENLVPAGVSVILQPSMQNCAASHLFPMFRALSVHVVYSEKDWPRLAATGALNLPVRAVVREHVEFQV